MPRKRVIIMGAAGRDFHNFNMCFRDDPDSQVVCFTAAQIPDIDGRAYPPALAGPLYPNGIPIDAEEDLESLIRKHRVDEVVVRVHRRVARARDAHGLPHRRTRGPTSCSSGRSARCSARRSRSIAVTRGAHGRGQEPDDAAHRADPEGAQA